MENINDFIPPIVSAVEMRKLLLQKKQLKLKNLKKS